MSYKNARDRLAQRQTVRRSTRYDPFVWEACFTRRESTRCKRPAPECLIHARAQLHDHLLVCAISRDDFLNYDPIEQGKVGACSLVGFLNLTSLVLGTAEREWTGLWNAVQKRVATKGTVEDVASLLDVLDLKDVTKNALVYVPIRSSRRGETSFHEMFENGGSQSVVVSIDAFLTTLLRQRIPVLVNAHEHTRVCVGYTKEMFIFADSWGNDRCEDEFDPLGRIVNRAVAGFSLAPRRLVASVARELVYMNAS